MGIYTLVSYAQPLYMMQNASVTDCEGILTDSDNGPEEGQYDHNEDFTFTICVEDAEEIILAFAFFSTEENYDILTVYDGTNTGAPVLAVLTGSVQPPPILIATSGCVTLQFTSDDNIVAAGWQMEWSVEIDEPAFPEITAGSEVICPLESLILDLDIPVDCDMLSPSSFTLLGPGGSTVGIVNSLNCDPEGLTQQVELIFSSPLVQPGTYRIIFAGSIQDACGNSHDFTTNLLFSLSNCPFNVDIELAADACSGDCGQVEAVIIGDAGVPYDYQWGHTGLNTPVVDICADMAITLSVTVTDPISMATAEAQYEYIPLEVPIILNPIADTVCSSIGDHYYTASLPGGGFYSTIIQDWQHESGQYQLWRWTWESSLNMDIVTYVAPNGCEAYDTLYIFPANAGSIEAVCLGSGTFAVNGGSPAGGEWSGPHVTADGNFSPDVAGSFVIAYTALNGCTDWKRVNVSDAIAMPDVDTICSSQEINLTADPYGGRWSGPGIVNAVAGTLQGWQVAPNQTYTYVYDLHGCSDTLEIYVQEIYAGPDLALCVEDSVLMLPQPGNWSGAGIYDQPTNSFDVSDLPEGEYDYTLSQNGCTDVFRLYIVDPGVNVFEPLAFCQEDILIPLADYLELYPDWGSLSGPAVSNINDSWYFNPSVAGAGNHIIEFSALGCSEEFTIEVEPFAQIEQYSFCELSNAQFLQADPPGGHWSGPGFLDQSSGLFDPQLLPPGTYNITYTTPSGCITTQTLDILIFEEVSISGVTQQYCFNDTVINIDISPPGGDFFLNGEIQGPSFNPTVLGSGNHELYYTRGTGPCASDQRIFISVLPPISGTIATPTDSICQGQNTVVEVDLEGGSGILTATWDQGLGFGVSHIVRPEQHSWYTVTVVDGCSEPYIDSAYVHVFPPFDIEVVEGPPVCHEDSSFLEILTILPGQYQFEWQLATVIEGPYIEGPPGIYQLEVTELFSGCVQEYDIAIPGPPPLSANFSIIPNQSCIDIIDNTIEIIDLSTGFTGGVIDFGDGSPQIEYLPGNSIIHEYTGIGDYEISLTLWNEMGCLDSLVRSICVKNKVSIYTPNVFSPNGDGTNDVFKLEAFGITEVEWAIYNRYGERVFQSFSTDEYWDGTFNGKFLNPEVFVLYLKYIDQATGEAGFVVGNITLVR